jgi:hypothetical protein
MIKAMKVLGAGLLAAFILPEIARRTTENPLARAIK